MKGRMNQILKKSVPLCLLLVSVLGVAGAFVPQTNATGTDLNDLMLEKFVDYDAMLTSQLSLNGTITDPYDRSQGVATPMYGKVSLSAVISLLPYARFYENTNNGYYLRKLQTIVDRIIDDSWFRATPNPTPPNEIIYCPQYWYDNKENDPTPKTTMLAGIVAVRLYQWTGETKYKILADRIASESMQLAVVNNSTDMAWAWCYYTNRDLTNAQIGVNRQGSIAYFYGVYGSVIDNSFLAYIPKIANWIWRAQTANKGLTYSIGTGSASAEYTAYSLYFIESAYAYASSQFIDSLKIKMLNSLQYLQNGTYGQSPLYYAMEYVSSASYVQAVKSGLISSPTQSFLNRTKTEVYIALTMIDIRARGFHVSLDDFSLGYRWNQFFVSSLFDMYPLPENLETYTAPYTEVQEIGTAGRYKSVGGGLGYYYNQHFDAGSIIQTGFTANYASVWLAYKSGTYDYSATAQAGYYKLWANITTPSMKALFYWYPSLVGFVNVTGTATLRLYVAFVTNAILRVNNGTEYALSSMTNGSKVFGNEFMVTRNVTTVRDRESWFLYSPYSTSWNFTRYASSIYIEMHNAVNYNATCMWLPSWKAFTTQSGANITTIYTNLRNIILAHHSITPIDFDTEIELYKKAINNADSVNGKFPSYQDAVSGDARLIAHSNPEKVNITRWVESIDALTFIINAPSGITSTAKIYCGNLGEPFGVRGATNWSYDASTGILTISVLHSSSTAITVTWPSAREDTTPPATTIDVSGVLGNNDWFTSDATVSLSATDDISGVDKTEYSFDNAILNTYTSSFTVSVEGTITIYYKSTDKAGNVETTKAETIKIDKTVPSGSIIINNGDAYTTSTSVTLTLAAADDTSGVYQVRYGNDNTWGTEPWESFTPTKTWTLPLGDGTKTVYYQIKDNAGLVSTSYSATITLSPPQRPAEAFPMWIVGVAVALIAIAAAGTLLLMKRK